MTVIEMPNSGDLVGRVLALGTVNKFTCYGFHLSRPFNTQAPVTEQADQQSLRRALDCGQLIDVTGATHKTGFSSQRLGGSTSPVTEQDTGKRVFYGRDDKGRLFYIIPKDEAEQRALEFELATYGKITPKCEPVVEIGRVEEEPVETPTIIITDLS